MRSTTPLCPCDAPSARAPRGSAPRLAARRFTTFPVAAAALLCVVGLACKDRAPAASAPQPASAASAPQPASTTPPPQAAPAGQGATLIARARPVLTAEGFAAADARCRGGDDVACLELGDAYRSLARYTESEAGWRVACERGHPTACFELGNLFTNPYLKLGKEREGIAVLRKACEGQHQAACYVLGDITESGRYGEKRDSAAARTFYELGCKYGHHWACEKVQGRQ